MTPGQYRTVSDLPDRLAVFPLSGALLFPRWSLPLNIFEPRYLNMIDDAMAGTRMIGMIQSVGANRAHPELARIGCAGRITSYAETDDGRYLISLSGVCRFEVSEELEVKTPYRQIIPAWAEFESDLKPPSTTALPDREGLVASLKRYTRVNQMEVDWEAVKSASLETLINALCAGCPFNTVEKQALLEAANLAGRAETLIALLDMDISGDDTSTLQ